MIVETRDEDVVVAAKTEQRVVKAAPEVEKNLTDRQRAALLAEGRRERAKRELDYARTDLQAARRDLWAAVREARDAGWTLPEIAGVLGVSVQRAQALAAKPTEPARR